MSRDQFILELRSILWNGGIYSSKILCTVRLSSPSLRMTTPLEYIPAHGV